MLEEDEKSPQANGAAKSAQANKSVDRENALDKRNHVPDILDCLADLSSDEVFTPPDLANQVLDQLPEEVWSDPNLRWLDPAVKTGVFLREAARRLMTGLEDAFPDEDERREHIFKNMLYGIAITELTGYVSRRSLYYNKAATSERSVVRFNHTNGNIFFEEEEHDFDSKNNCKVCGASKPLGNKRDGMENYAYPFLHSGKIFTDMKFDVIIGNPPYQLDDGGHGASALPIYHFFVEKALDLKPRYISFIIPARWYAGGKGLDNFRKQMISNRHIRVLVDYTDAGEVFPGVEIKGGICYFLWDAKYDGDCLVKTMSKGELKSSKKRDLRLGGDILIRSNEAVSILEKVQRKKEDTLDKKVSSRKPFGLATNFNDFAENKASTKNIKLYVRGGVGWVSRDQITKNSNWINKYKTITAEASEGKGFYPKSVLGKPIVTAPNSACTETYIVLGIFDTKKEAENLASYFKTKFFRFLVDLHKITQHGTAKVYASVPDLPMDRKTPWTDKELYKRYGLTKEEIEHIEATIREMD